MAFNEGFWEVMGVILGATSMMAWGWKGFTGTLTGLILFWFFYWLIIERNKKGEVENMSIKKLSIYCQEHNKKVSIKNGKLKGILKEDKK